MPIPDKEEKTMAGIRPLCIATLLALRAPFAASPADKPAGWASLNGGTTGGAGGAEVTVTTMADLQKYAKMEGKYVIWVKGTMGNAGASGESDGDRVAVASDKSILGLPGAEVNGGFDLRKGVANIVIRNLRIRGPGAKDVDGLDAVAVQDKVRNVWFDHLDIADGEDGNLDITHACDYITVSWTRFSYTSKSTASGGSGKHRFCNLIGHSDNNESEDAGHLLVTFYKTWWGDGVAERMPRVRFGKVHVANCLFTSKDPGQSHCIRPAHKADVLAESNAFLGQNDPIDIAFDGTFTAATVRNNLFSGCKGNTAGRGTAFAPPYAALAFTDPAQLEAELGDARSGAGATLSWGAVTPVLLAPKALSAGAWPAVIDLAGRRLGGPARGEEGGWIRVAGKAAGGRPLLFIRAR
jgi:pectate lyase